MKRVLAIVLSLLLAFSMIGCSDQSNAAQNADAQGNSNATAVSSDDTAGNADPWNVAVFTMSGSGEFWASVMAGAEPARNSALSTQLMVLLLRPLMSSRLQWWKMPLRRALMPSASRYATPRLWCQLSRLQPQRELKLSCSTLLVIMTV